MDGQNGPVGPPRILAPSLGVRVQGSPVATPEAIPWGHQVGVGVAIRLDINHRGEEYVVTVDKDLSLKVRASRAGGELAASTAAGDGTRITVLRRAQEALGAAIEAIEMASDQYRRVKIEASRVSSRKARGKSAWPEPPDTPQED